MMNPDILRLAGHHILFLMISFFAFGKALFEENEINLSGIVSGKICNIFGNRFLRPIF
jgi:hypothetical protein